MNILSSVWHNYRDTAHVPDILWETCCTQQIIYPSENGQHPPPVVLRRENFTQPLPACSVSSYTDGQVVQVQYTAQCPLYVLQYTQTMMYTTDLKWEFFSILLRLTFNWDIHKNNLFLKKSTLCMYIYIYSNCIEQIVCITLTINRILYILYTFALCLKNSFLFSTMHWEICYAGGRIFQPLIYQL